MSEMFVDAKKQSHNVEEPCSLFNHTIRYEAEKRGLQHGGTLLDCMFVSYMS